MKINTDLFTSSTDLVFKQIQNWDPPKDYLVGFFCNPELKNCWGFNPQP